MNLPYTRAIVNAIVEGKLDKVPAIEHPVFHVGVPTSCPNVPARILDARGQWDDGAAYDGAAQALLARFQENFAGFGAAEELVENDERAGALRT